MKPNAPQSWKDAISSLPPDGCDTGACPAPQQIWSAVVGELSPDEFGEVADHAATCPVCALAWQMAEKGSAATGRARTEQKRRPWRAWYGLAAAAMLVAALVIQFRVSAPDPLIVSPEYRAPVEETVHSELDGVVLDRVDCSLSWSGPEEATYDILIATEDFQILHQETGLTERSFRIPAQALESIPSGGAIVWQVEAVLADGTRIPSRTFRVTIK